MRKRCRKYRNVKPLYSVFANRKFRKLFKQGNVIYLGFHSFSPFENPLLHVLYLSFLCPCSFIVMTLACCCCCCFFSRVRLCATPQTAAHQGSPVPGILQARTLEWVAISFSNAWKWKVKVKSLSCVDPMDCSLPGSSPGKSTGVGCHCLLQTLV